MGNKANNREGGNLHTHDEKVKNKIKKRGMEKKNQLKRDQNKRQAFHDEKI